MVNHRNGSKEDFADLLNERRLMSSNETAESDRDGRLADVRAAHSISTEAFTFNALASFSTTVIVGLRAARSISLT